jgi:23S rRNA pseudouridine955/2504/2580 synthase
MTELTIKANDANQKLFSFIKKVFRDTKLSIIYKWFRVGKIKINGKKTKDRDYVLQLNDIVQVYDASSNVKKREWQKIDYSTLDIVYEDQNILVADKNFNVEIHSDFNDCLDNMVRSYLFDKGEFKKEENSFIVSHIHRLDKLTSGLVMYAKNKPALDFFLANITDKNKIRKTYIAKFEGRLDYLGIVSGWIDYNGETQIATFSEDEFRMSKKAELNIVAIEDDYATIELITGRKHQIRATMEYMGCPIVNDFRYGAHSRSREKYIALNAYILEFADFEGDFAYLNGKAIYSKKISF